MPLAMRLMRTFCLLCILRGITQVEDEDLLETNTGGTSKVYMGKSEARAKMTRTLEDEYEEPLYEYEHE